MLRFFKRLFCKHEYEFVKSQIVDAGRTKETISRCKHCGKVRVRLL